MSKDSNPQPTGGKSITELFEDVYTKMPRRPPGKYNRHSKPGLPNTQLISVWFFKLNLHTDQFWVDLSDHMAKTLVKMFKN